MEDGLIRVTPDREKAKSMLKMADTTIEMVRSIDIGKFSSNITKDYYDAIRELISIILLLDGYKTYGEGAHKKLVEYLQSKYNEFGYHEISFIDNLRITRNKIAYDGFFVEKDYIERNLKKITNIIDKLKMIIHKKL